MIDIIILCLIVILYVIFVFVDLFLYSERSNDNWHILKKYVKENLSTDNLMQGVLDKMEELESSDSNVKNKRNNK